MPDMDEIIGRIRRDMDTQLRKRARRALGEGADRAGWSAETGPPPPGAAAPLAAGGAEAGARGGPVLSEGAGPAEVLTR
ncbi:MULTISPECIES: hypothetical protein [Streptomyces]|uniref:hypothetical protein n=1 Tax=Streptomyces TaxID=1883 RepID=UPI00163CD75B|nr:MULTISPECIES: hypothetical protein [Streptomyces]MBC2879591.1 hypothetical protein [Streptomyces sp. TYQ1024]UBI40139.1 hypothetical protein K7I03_29230 [Streptomyces mobaraensis]UKW32718.1 hypothetical protein MCU78_29160 [Streptomyces sp. TYQ1024]